MSRKKKSGGSNARIIIIVVVLALMGVAAYLTFGHSSPEKLAAANAKAYIEGIQKGDFDTIFKYNAYCQRRKALIMQRATGNKEQEVKDLYAEMKASFDSVAQTADLRAQWVEKFLFTPGAVYRIVSVNMVQDTENPSQPSSKRINAVLTVTVDYPDAANAPDLSGKVKSVEYKVTMIHSRNLSRMLRDDVQDNRWVFQSIQVKPDTLKYH